MAMINKEPTNKDILAVVEGVKGNTEQILEAIGLFSNKAEGRFDQLEGRMDKVEDDITTIKTKMVTRDHLDEKLSDLKGDLSILLRKEDKKLAELVKVLEERKVLSREDVRRILAMEPFPQS